MKAQIDSNGGSGGGGVGGVRDGKVHKNRHHHNNHGHKEEENEEIKAYLSKLQQLVPFMPKNRRLSKLELITHVIDYIRDLRQTLGLPPCIGNNDFDMESASAIMMASQPLQPSPVNPSAITANVTSSGSSSTPSAPVPNSASSPHQHHHHHQHHPHQRQPLCPISNPNGNTNSSSGSHEIPPLTDKSPSDDADSRPVSC